MGRVYISIKPFKDSLGEEYADDFTDITNDVVDSGLSDVSRYLDNNEFDIGVIRHASFNITLANTQGKYSDVGNVNSIFNFTRNNSIIRIEWDRNNELYCLGFHRPGLRPTSSKFLIGDFFLSDDLVRLRSNDERVTFTCLGYSTLFDRVEVPFTTINNGDLLSEIIFKCLNQSFITRYLDVDANNINCSVDLAVDDKTLGDLQNKTVTEAFKKLLQFSNSILVIQRGEDSDGNAIDEVIVKPRDASADLEYTFYGAGVPGFFDNLIEIYDFNNGLKRVKNLVTIKDSGTSARDESSIAQYGVRKKEIEFLPVSDLTKQQQVVDAIRDEFGQPKKEMKIRVPLSEEILELSLLDRVNVDYPLRVIPTFGGVLPQYNQAVVGEDFYPHEVLDIEIAKEIEFKILSIDLDLADEEAIIEIREI